MTIEAQRIILRMLSIKEINTLYPLPEDVKWETAGYTNACNDVCTIGPNGYTFYCTLNPNHDGPHVAHLHSDRSICGAWTSDRSYKVDKNDNIKPVNDPLRLAVKLANGESIYNNNSCPNCTLVGYGFIGNERWGYDLYTCTDHKESQVPDYLAPFSIHLTGSILWYTDRSCDCATHGDINVFLESNLYPEHILKPLLNKIKKELT